MTARKTPRRSLAWLAGRQPQASAWQQTLYWKNEAVLGGAAGAPAARLPRTRPASLAANGPAAGAAAGARLPQASRGLQNHGPEQGTASSAGQLALPSRCVGGLAPFPGSRLCSSGALGNPWPSSMAVLQRDSWDGCRCSCRALP